LEPPFKSISEYQVFERIKNVEYSFPKNDAINDDAIDLIKRLLVKKPEERLGSNSRSGLMFSDLRGHPYFKNVKYENIFNSKVP
jgi:serine/threonine protein kinase